MSADRDTVLPRGGADCAADVYRQAGITDPRTQVDCVEMYVPFSWFEPMWLENLGFAAAGEGWKLVEDGVTALDGDLPVNMSGGVLSSNPIGASGHAPLRRGGQPGPGPGRRAPGRRRPHRGGPRLRRRLAVLRHVGRGSGQASDRPPRGQGRHRHRRGPGPGRGGGPAVRRRGRLGAPHRRPRRGGRGRRRRPRRRGRLPAPRRHLRGRVDGRGGRRRGPLRPGLASSSTTPASSTSPPSTTRTSSGSAASST